MAAEIAFEYLLAALEAAAGTPEDAPALYLPIEGTLNPEGSYYAPAESRGTLEAAYREERVREWATFEGSGPADPEFFHILMEMLVKSGVSPTQPDDATAPNTYLWEYVPSSTPRKSATLWFGDPNVQVFRGAFGMLEELSLSSDASGEEGATFSMSGRTQFPAKVVAPAEPGLTVGPILYPLWMQMWLDTDDPIGTTEITGRLVSVEHTFPGAVTFKHLAAGPGASKTYTQIGRDKRRISTTIQLELADMDQYDLFEQDALVKLRIRHNGPQISTDEIGADPAYYYIEVDTYGRLKFDGWGDHEGTNRTINLLVESLYDSTLGASWRVAVQNTQAALPA